MLSCTSFNKLAKGKSQSVPKNLDNPKNRHFRTGLGNSYRDLTPESFFLTYECLFLTSESTFIWVYNQTLPTKPNLSESLSPTSEYLFGYSQPKRARFASP